MNGKLSKKLCFRTPCFIQLRLITFELLAPTQFNVTVKDLMLSYWRWPYDGSARNLICNRNFSKECKKIFCLVWSNWNTLFNIFTMGVRINIDLLLLIRKIWTSNVLFEKYFGNTVKLGYNEHSVITNTRL